MSKKMTKDTDKNTDNIGSLIQSVLELCGYKTSIMNYCIYDKKGEFHTINVVASRLFNNKKTLKRRSK